MIPYQPLSNPFAPNVLPYMMIHEEYYECGIKLRRESVKLREQWLANKSLDAKFFRELASDE